MKTIGDLLRSADPLGHEPIWSPQTRLAARQVVLAGIRASLSSVPWLRRPIVVAIVAAALVLVAGTIVGPRFWSPVIQAAVRFEVRLAEEAPAAGLHEVTVTTAGRAIYLHQEVVVTNSDIAQAKVVPGDGPSSFGVEVTFSTAGADEMRRATQGHVGKPVAILIDGKVVAVPTLRSPISQSAVISGDFTRGEAERIANGMIGK